MFDYQKLQERITLRNNQPEALAVSVVDLPDQFVVLSVLGTGGMGTVYKCKNKYTERIVAIKVLHETRTEDLAGKRFVLEAKAASALVHENAVSVHDFGITAGGKPYMVMEHLKGETLAEIIKGQGLLPEEFVASVMVSACEALQAAHKLGIIHRDIKPGNIMLALGKDGKLSVKVLDFGIAKIIGGQSNQNLTKTGEIFGTPLYMSPEQCVGENTDFRSDIYSLGACMYECLGGQAPNQGDNALQTMFKKASEDAQPLRQIQPNVKVSRPFENIVMNALCRDPDSRYQTISALLSDLKPFATNSYSSKVGQADARNIRREKLDGKFPAHPPELVQGSARLQKQSKLQAGLAFLASIFLIFLILSYESYQADRAKNLEKDGLSDLQATKFSDADRKFRSAIEIMKGDKSTTKVRLRNLYDWLSQSDEGIGAQSKDYSKFEESTKEAINLSEQLRDRKAVAVLYLRLGTGEIFSNKVEQAIPALEKSLSMSKEMKALSLEKDCLDKLSFAYKYLGDYEKCEHLCNDLINLSKNQDDKFARFFLASAYSRLGECDLHAIRYKSARTNLQKAEDLLSSLKPEVAVEVRAATKAALNELSRLPNND